jgi:hypothetical protein
MSKDTMLVNHEMRTKGDVAYQLTTIMAFWIMKRAVAYVMNG